jgi:hypothetical protein
MRADEKGFTVNRTTITNAIRLVAAGVGCLSSLCAAKGPADLLADRSDAVVVAEVQSGQQTGRSVAFALSIVRTIKGDLTSGTTVDVAGTAGVSAGASGFRSLGGQYGLWFLKKSGGQGASPWTFLPVSQGASWEISGYVPLLRTASPASIAAPAAPTTTGDRMAMELVAALEQYTDAGQLYPVALSLSRIGESPLLPALYGVLRTNSDPELKFIGLSGLLGGAEESQALAEIAGNIDLARNLHTSPLLAMKISSVRSSGPEAVASLARIAASPDAGFERSAAVALENIHSRGALPVLVQLLDSNDALARECAMAGLSRFVDNLPIQTPQNIPTGTGLLAQGPAPYRTPATDEYSLSRRQLGAANEAEYLQFWKSWWTAAKDDLAADE